MRAVGTAKRAENIGGETPVEHPGSPRAPGDAGGPATMDRADLAERLLAILGHELRSPLAAITMASFAMGERERLTEEDRRTVALIQRSAARMARMVQQMISFTWVRMGDGGGLDREDTDLFEVAGDVLAELELAHRGRLFQLQTSGEAAGFWDRLKLGEVLSNLLSNAVQYGDARRPVSLTIRGLEGGVELLVHNEGSPIPIDLLPHLFEPFQRARREQTPPDRSRRRTGNLGLGLHIVREIVAAHGGTIAVTSTAKEGTTFAVHLPRR
jgi:signal transduction histidine kinase